MFRLVLAVSLAVAVVAVVQDRAGALSSGATAPARCGKLLAPEQQQGAYFGLMYPREWDVSPARIRSVELQVGRAVTFATFTIPWGTRLTFPRAQLLGLWKAGYIPLLRLFTFPTLDYDPSALPPSQYPGPIAMSAIASGTHDSELQAWAGAARATGIPILLDVDPEMNNAHPWGGRFDGAGVTTGYGDPSWPDGPEHYRDAYRRIVTIFRAEGATNVSFFFHPDTVFGYSADSYTEPFEQMRWYYPGDDYVDWIGLSVYSNPNKPDGSNTTFEEKLATFHAPGYAGTYSEITSLSSRPLAINELGLYATPSLTTEQAKAQWVTAASAVIRSGRYPRIAAVNWWGDDATGSPWNGDPTRSPEFEAAFRSAFDQVYFNPRPRFSGDCTPPIPTGLTARAASHAVQLRWHGSDSTTAYEVWRSGKRIRVVTTTHLDDHSVKRRRTYVYRIRALNPLGTSRFGAGIRATVGD